jgi:hypothetical protein
MYDRAAAVRELARQLGRAASQDVLIVTVAGADSVRQASGELAFSPRQDIRFAVWYLITETQLVADYFMEETIEHAEYVLVRA